MWFTSTTVAKVALSVLSNASATSQLAQIHGLLENAKANEISKEEKLQLAKTEKEKLQGSVEAEQQELDSACSEPLQDSQKVASVDNELSICISN